MKLDYKDQIILECLMQDCKMPVKKIAKLAHLTHPGVLYRIKKLEKNKYIERYDALLDLGKLPVDYWLIAISVPNKKIKSFEEYCKKNKSIMSLTKHVHKFNYFISSPLNQKDQRELINYLEKNKLNYKLWKIKQQKAFDYRIFNDVNLPLKKVEQSKQKIKLDKKDLKLIETLFHGGGKLSAMELSKKTNLTADLVVYRLRKLNKAKYFIRYFSQPNQEKFNLNYITISFKIKNLEHSEIKKIFQKTMRTVLLFKSEDNNYLATLITNNLEDLEKTLDLIYKELDENLIELEIYPIRGWVFLNRLDLKRIYGI